MTASGTTDPRFAGNESGARQRVMVVYGTRPEAIKMSPVVRCLRADPNRFEPVVVSTGQHREMIQQVEDLFHLQPDIDLDLMVAEQGLNALMAKVTGAVDALIDEHSPDWILVQGDTLSAMAAGLAGFHREVAVGHVEAGLRTGDLSQPFPEEASRRIIDTVARLCFAPTARAVAALLGEGISPDRVPLTGNTVVDALLQVADSMGPIERRDEVLITVHRRESFGEPLREILGAVADLAAAHPSTRWIFPVHPNPQVSGPAHEVLGGVPNVQLLEPLNYQDLVRHLRAARLVLTDSGGIQEEAPTFGTPVLVLREVTERPEGVDVGVARLVGVDRLRITASATEVLTDDAVHRSMSTAANPYGDGRAAERIVGVLAGDNPLPFT